MRAQKSINEVVAFPWSSGVRENKILRTDVGSSLGSGRGGGTGSYLRDAAISDCVQKKLALFLSVAVSQGSAHGRSNLSDNMSEDCCQGTVARVLLPIVLPDGARPCPGKATQLQEAQ